MLKMRLSGWSTQHVGAVIGPKLTILTTTPAQMIRQCVRPDQKDWVMKLPAVEFAVNSARSSTTGFSPFQLNYGRNPSPMIWNTQDEFPGVRKFAEKMKMAIMSAHDSIIAARIANTVQANRKRAPVHYEVGDLVYLSTKNISLPKGRAPKLAPKFLGPFAITKVLKEGATYQLDLSEELLKRGINRSFHASLLKPHVPNDDRRFPGRLPAQIPGFGEKPEEWIVDSIISHHGKGVNSEFEIAWKAGDRTWAPYREVAHLIAMDRYCELMGVGGPHDLPASYAKKGNFESAAVSVIRVFDERYKSWGARGVGDSNPLSSPTMSRHFTTDEWNECSSYARRLDRYRRDAGPHPGPAPPRYSEYRRMFEEGGRPYPPENPAASHDVAPNTPTPPGNISMPTDAFSTFFDAQYRMVELMVGAGARGTMAMIPQPAPRTTFKPKPGKPTYRSSRGRGVFRGRPDRRSPFRAIRPRNPNAVLEDIPMPDAATLFPDLPDLFGPEPNATAGPSSLIVSTSNPPIDSVAGTPGGFSDQLMTVVEDLNMEGLGSGSGTPKAQDEGENGDEVADFN